MLLDTAASNVTNPQTKQNLQSLSSTITNVDNAVVAFEDGRYNDAIGFAADTVGQPLSTKTRNFVDTIQTKANTAEKLVKAVKAKDVSASTALLRELTDGKGGEFIDLIDKVDTAADKVKKIKNAVDKNDFSAAVGLASSLSEDLTGKAAPSQIADVQKLITAVENGDVQASADLINNLTNGKHSNALNFIKTADNAVGKAEDLKRAIDNKDFATAASLANSLSQDISGHALPEQITTAANLVEAVQSGDVSGSASLLRELTNGKHSTVLDMFDKVGVATDQVRALETAIKGNNFAEAASIASSLSTMASGKDSTLSNTLGNLSDVLSGKVQVPLNGLPGNVPGMTPGFTPLGTGVPGMTPGFNPLTTGTTGMARGFGNLAMAAPEMSQEYGPTVPGTAGAFTNPMAWGATQPANDDLASQAIEIPPPPEMNTVEQAAFDSINNNLAQGLFNDVSREELLAINTTLSELTPNQKNNVIANLSDDKLETWGSEINGLRGSLNTSEKNELYAQEI